MCVHITSQVIKRDLGTITRKAVMMLLSDYASADGSGIWASKQRLADELCTTKRTVQRTIVDFDITKSNVIS